MSKHWYANANWDRLAQDEFYRRINRAKKQRAQMLKVKASYLWRTGDEALARAALALLQQAVDEHTDDELITAVLKEKALCHAALKDRREASACFKLCLDYEQRDEAKNTAVWKDYCIFLAKHDDSTTELNTVIDSYCPSKLEKPFMQTAMQAIYAKHHGGFDASQTAGQALKLVGADTIGCADLHNQSYYEAVIDELEDIRRS